MRRNKLDGAFGLPGGAVELLLDGALHGTPVEDCIDLQEKRGQAEMTHKERLPLKCGDRELWEHLGFVFGEPEDDLFVACTFPTGWSVVPTDHSMYSDIIDDQGRKRGSIGYKAAFYDQWAQANLTNRYVVNRWQPVTTDGQIVVSLEDHAQQPVKTVHKVSCPMPKNNDEADERRETYLAKDALEDQMTDWLKTNLPDWQNPLAYW
ncbi:MAG: hypothetical protein JSS66_06070 [Armatimonadetes bacterium]|nr:hypothetical protein [Armatimonadota bacterium]